MDRRTSGWQDEQAPLQTPAPSSASDGFKIHKVLQILGVSLALAAYSWMVSARVGHTSAATARSIPATDIPLIDLAEAKALWSSPGTVFVDVRSAFDYQLGHIAGAVNLPAEEWDRRFAALQPRLKTAAAVVVYCQSVDCGKSYWSALRLRQAGFLQVKIYPEGWYEWRARSLPSAGTP